MGGFEGFVAQALFEFTLTPFAFLLLVFFAGGVGLFFVSFFSLEMLVWGYEFVGSKRKITPKTGISSFIVGPGSTSRLF